MTVPPESLFSEYVYFSSFSETLLEHSRVSADRYIEEFSLNSSSRIVEIASNDGYLLKNFLSKGIPCLGVEPARNIAETALANGIPTEIGFFSADLAADLRRRLGVADLVIGNNVLAHVPRINDFISGIGRLLSESGRVVLEFPYACDLIDNSEFDTIYHEHIFYFTITSLSALFSRHRLEIFRAEHIPIHGGSLRIFAAHEGAFPTESCVAEIYESENHRGISDFSYYESLNERTRERTRRLRSRIKAVLDSGKRLAAYGASAKGSTLLNYCGLSHREIDFLADRSQHKQGKWTPGTRIPIVPAGELERRQPDYTLLLTWNFAPEILAQQEPYRRKGGLFIVPFPEIEVV